MFSTKQSFQTIRILEKLTRIQPDLIVLAGFLLKFPDHIINAFPE